ncbi:MAG: isocitrate lyase/phosphoenolpyruvate mutase family protein, partial [Devosiaceae bacterium]|nr:isocitrate lyase/phosphoenolpyruvate mutase family protein [Devosiaceae bacterium]
MNSFRKMHVSGDPFILANAWDMGSARMLAAAGAKALGTTSAGFGFSQGVPDMGNLSRDVSIAHGKEMVEATPLPVSADLENGFGHKPEDVTKTIILAMDAGLAGCCIEDTMLPHDTPYGFSDAVARIEAAACVAREESKKRGVDFVLTARADGMMLGQYDLAKAIARLKAFEAVGADVLYAPRPP